MESWIITKDILELRLAEGTASLLNMARDMVWNKLSDNCLYIISNIGDCTLDFAEINALRKQKNDKKTPHPLKNLMQQLLELYPDFYDINLFIYKCSRSLTIIEIAYFPKSALEPVYRVTVENDSLMFHCKVPIPFYSAVGKKRKFDINWQNNTLSNIVNSFWARLKYKVKLAFNLKVA